MSHRSAVLGTLSVALLVAGMMGASPATAVTKGRQTYLGTIDGADYRVEMPAHWNGTLVLYSHGYFPPGFKPDEIMVANRPDTAEWLLEHGYALAASSFLGTSGAVYDRAQVDQLALLDWFEANIGHPKRTIATGSSSGAALSILLAERNPKRVDGVLGLCGPLDITGSWNLSLDITFAIKTLLAPPDAQIDLVRPSNAFGSAQAVQEAVTAAADDPVGRARLALVNAVGNVPAWNSAIEPQPVGDMKQIETLAKVDEIYVWVFGPTGRPDLEQRAGGNPSWNVGVNYRHQLARSVHRDLVRRAYQKAGLDLDVDLAKLAAAPRIAADPGAVEWLTGAAVARGTTPSPVLTMHATADSAVVDHERWYAERVRHHGNPNRLHQLYTERATHCAFTAAEEIVAFRTLLAKIDTGRWPETGPRTLNAAAAKLPDRLQFITDFGTQQEKAVPPAYTRCTPPSPLRPTR